VTGRTFYRLSLTQRGLTTWTNVVAATAEQVLTEEMPPQVVQRLRNLGHM